MNKQHNALVWFRQDLRVSDHLPLTQACEYAKSTGGKVFAVYFVTPKQWAAHDVAPVQVDFIASHLEALSLSLASIGVTLEIIHLEVFDDILPWLKQYCAEQNVANIFAAHEPEFNERQRDKAIIDAGLPLTLLHHDCILPYGSVTNLSGDMYKVFTPFSKAWRKQAVTQALWPLPTPTFAAAIEPMSVLAIIYGEASEYREQIKQLWPVGSDAAKDRLAQFVSQKIEDYQTERDIPSLDSTSQLSPYLAIGAISPKQCLGAVLYHYPEAIVDDATPAKTWLNELIWREFYRHLLVAFPKLSRNQNFNALGDNIQWRNNKDEFNAWCEGRTGYPIVDAAMRQLNQTGWMHNRLRMIVASFLTKHLLIDWRWGERYFRQKLIDGDLAANNGGWQWSAGTGCDAQPYFRVFNPMTQSEKFDPDASFIKRFVPEVTTWPLKHIHHPHLRVDSVTTIADMFVDNIDVSSYPKPIVEHSAARIRAIEVLGALKRG